MQVYIPTLKVLKNTNTVEFNNVENVKIYSVDGNTQLQKCLKGKLIEIQIDHIKSEREITFEKCNLK